MEFLLSAPLPFTVFAPTDEAFAKIAKKDLDALQKDKKKLVAVLTYHVVPGSVMAARDPPASIGRRRGSDEGLTGCARWLQRPDGQQPLTMTERANPAHPHGSFLNFDLDRAP